MQQCNCGKQSGVTGMSPNFFAEVINMADLLDCYEMLSKPDSKHDRRNERHRQHEPSELEKLEADVASVYQKFVTGFKEQLKQRQNVCVHDNPNPDSKVAHQSLYHHWVGVPFPEVMTFNLNWDKNPKPSQVLKVLASVPEYYDLSDIFHPQKQQKQYYVLRGMVCFSEGGHYLGFFRRIALKMSYLVSAENSDQSSFQRQWNALRREVTPQREWVQYNDTELKYISDNWPAVIERCIEQNFYPTILFFEKLHDCEEDTDYTKSREFNIKPGMLHQLAELAAQMDLFASQNMEDIYGDDEIKRQIEIEKELMESFKKEKMAAEESKEERKGPDGGKDGSRPDLKREENTGSNKPRGEKDV